jgi:hypothetical protein
MKRDVHILEGCVLSRISQPFSAGKMSSLFPYFRNETGGDSRARQTARASEGEKSGMLLVTVKELWMNGIVVARLF